MQKIKYITGIRLLETEKLFYLPNDHIDSFNERFHNKTYSKIPYNCPFMQVRSEAKHGAESSGVDRLKKDGYRNEKRFPDFRVRKGKWMLSYNGIPLTYVLSNNKTFIFEYKVSKRFMSSWEI